MEKRGLMLFAAGGTGGHIAPALAVAEAVQSLVPVEIAFIGVGKSVEHRLIESKGYRLFTQPSVPVVGAGPLGVIRFLRGFPTALRRATSLLRELDPNVVVGFGGFPSFVPLVAAWRLGIPRALQEQNAQVGVANRVASLFVSRIFAVPNATGFLKKVGIEVVPNPVRSEFLRVREWQFPSESEPLTLLVMGGSQGARRINEAVVALLPFLKARGLHLIHQTGSLDHEKVLAAYARHPSVSAEVLPFIDDVARALERAHLVVARAGAMSVAEIMAAGRPAIFVPLPISRGHQEKNVELLSRRGLVRVVPQNERLVPGLERVIDKMIEDRKALSGIAQALRAHASRGEESAATFLARQLLEMGGIERVVVEPSPAAGGVGRV